MSSPPCFSPAVERTPDVVRQEIQELEDLMEGTEVTV